ncbi:phosphoribosyltransferase [Calothrix rhizosoleniae]|uniref:phosphoribosyltransferase n=1 Tax=Calothrix rhizosoleniae TaxID=888997 RepID=UPI000B49DDC4|nr:phosphoribosyltransferase [Calothrix rhizosoleniae]
MTAKFRDRTEAGKMLAQKLITYTNRKDGLVMALPRGGVPVGYEVAKKLNIPLDICIVRKLGVPGHKELAMGAIASGGVRILNYDVVSWLNISSGTIDEVATHELRELQRRDQVYRGDRSPPDVRNKTIILVDDGIATGSTIRAAIAILQQQQPRRIVIATPVAPLTVCQELQALVDEVVRLSMPEPFYAIGLWYDNFAQTTDAEVRELLDKSNHRFNKPQTITR